MNFVCQVETRCDGHVLNHRVAPTLWAIHGTRPIAITYVRVRLEDQERVGVTLARAGEERDIDVVGRGEVDRFRDGLEDRGVVADLAGHETTDRQAVSEALSLGAST